MRGPDGPPGRTETGSRPRWPSCSDQYHPLRQPRPRGPRPYHPRTRRRMPKQRYRGQYHMQRSSPGRSITPCAKPMRRRWAPWPIPSARRSTRRLPPWTSSAGRRAGCLRLQCRAVLRQEGKRGRDLTAKLQNEDRDEDREEVWGFQCEAQRPAASLLKWARRPPRRSPPWNV